MAFDSLQARQLYLAEGLELCQQIKEGLLILSHAPTPLTHQKVMQWSQMLYQGALKLELTDIQLWSESLAALVESDDVTHSSSVVHELLHHLCDGLQLALISYSCVDNTTPPSSQYDSVMHSLMPKVLEIFEVVLTQPLFAQLQTQLLMQQVKWMQFWSRSLNLEDLNSITVATLSAFEKFPQSILAIAPVALAGLQVAYETTLRLSESSLVDDSLPIAPQHQPSPSAQALTVFNTAQYLVGLTHQTLFCIASNSIEEMLLYETSQILHRDEQEYMVWRDRQLPLHHFMDLWQPSHPQNHCKADPKSAWTILILKQKSQWYAVALEVERLIVEPQIRLKPFVNVSASTPQRCCYGIAMLSDGLELEVVDVNCLLTIEPLRKQPQSIASSSSKTILIVDDSRTVRESLSLTLASAGYSVLQAQDGQQAIEQLTHQATIHLIICDLEMSNFNGFEFLRYRLQDPYWLKIPVVILSSHTDDEYRQLSQKLGAVDYFTIPYDSKTLIRSIDALVNT